jgi:hypothetical protein
MEYENTFIALFLICFLIVLLLFGLLETSWDREKELECIYWALEKEKYEEGLKYEWIPNLNQLEQCLPFNINLQ